MSAPTRPDPLPARLRALADKKLALSRSDEAQAEDYGRGLLVGHASAYATAAGMAEEWQAAISAQLKADLTQMLKGRGDRWDDPEEVCCHDCWEYGKAYGKSAAARVVRGEE